MLLLIFFHELVRSSYFSAIWYRFWWSTLLKLTLRTFHTMHGKIIEIAERLLILSELQKLGEKNVSHSTEKILFSDTCDMLALVVGEVRPRDIVAREKIDALALELGLRDPSASKKLKIDSITSCKLA